MVSISSLKLWLQKLSTSQTQDYLNTGPEKPWVMKYFLVQLLLGSNRKKEVSYLGQRDGLSNPSKLHLTKSSLILCLTFWNNPQSSNSLKWWDTCWSFLRAPTGLYLFNLVISSNCMISGFSSPSLPDKFITCHGPQIAEVKKQRIGKYLHISRRQSYFTFPRRYGRSGYPSRCLHDYLPLVVAICLGC